MPGPGRSTESLQAGACPGIRPAGATGRLPAQGTPGGGGGTGSAGHVVTCERGGLLNQDTHNTPEKEEAREVFRMYF